MLESHTNAAAGIGCLCTACYSTLATYILLAGLNYILLHMLSMCAPSAIPQFYTKAFI